MNRHIERSKREYFCVQCRDTIKLGKGRLSYTVLIKYISCISKKMIDPYTFYAGQIVISRFLDEDAPIGL